MEDCDGLKYVGSTTKSLEKRHSRHKYENTGSVRKMKVKFTHIWLLEICNEKNRYEREQYYIDTIDCVNIANAVYDINKKYKKTKKWMDENRKYVKEYNKQYRIKNAHIFNSDKNKQKTKIYNKQLRLYKTSWGANSNGLNNDLLLISMDVFS